MYAWISAFRNYCPMICQPFEPAWLLDRSKRLFYISSVSRRDLKWILYVMAQGDAVDAMGRRRWINTHGFRGNSDFQIGGEWVKASLLKRWELISTVCCMSHHDPYPARDSTLASKVKNDAIDLSFRFTLLSM